MVYVWPTGYVNFMFDKSVININPKEMKHDLTTIHVHCKRKQAFSSQTDLRVK